MNHVTLPEHVKLLVVNQKEGDNIVVEEGAAARQPLIVNSATNILHLEKGDGEVVAVAQHPTRRGLMVVALRRRATVGDRNATDEVVEDIEMRLAAMTMLDLQKKVSRRKVDIVGPARTRLEKERSERKQSS